MGNNSGAIAHYNGSRVKKEIRFGTRSLNVLTDQLETATWDHYKHNVSIDFGSTVRHEYAHHIDAKILTNKEVMEWIDVWNKVGRTRFRKEVSHYAGTDRAEAFAESFSVYTAPGYNPAVETTRLPKEVEEFMKRVIGVPKD